jgi:hypothetical protein
MASERSTVGAMVVREFVSGPGLFVVASGLGLVSGFACLALSRVCFEKRMS